MSLSSSNIFAVLNEEAKATDAVKKSKTKWVKAPVTDFIKVQSGETNSQRLAPFRSGADIDLYQVKLICRDKSCRAVHRVVNDKSRYGRSLYKRITQREGSDKSSDIIPPTACHKCGPEVAAWYRDSPNENERDLFDFGVFIHEHIRLVEDAK
mgnify:CR=1 FL=1